MTCTQQTKRAPTVLFILKAFSYHSHVLNSHFLAFSIFVAFIVSVIE